MQYQNKKNTKTIANAIPKAYDISFQIPNKHQNLYQSNGAEHKKHTPAYKMYREDKLESVFSDLIRNHIDWVNEQFTLLSHSLRP